MSLSSAEILNRVDIVDVIKAYIPLTKVGDNYKAVCCFHNDHTPSLSVSPRLGIFKCFVCEAKGNAASFIAQYEDITYYEALSKLAKKIGRADLAPAIEQEEYKDVLVTNRGVLNYYHNLLLTKTDESEAAIEFLKKRKISKETAKIFELGYSPNSWTWLINQDITKKRLRAANLVIKSPNGLSRDVFKNRIIFPFYKNKKVIGFTGRTLGKAKKTPKYLNSRESDWYKKKDLLYGFNLTKSAIKKSGEVVIVEGQFDLIQLYQRGIHNVIAVSGSYFGEHQSKMLSKIVDKAIIVPIAVFPNLLLPVKVKTILSGLFQPFNNSDCLGLAGIAAVLKRYIL